MRYASIFFVVVFLAAALLFSSASLPAQSSLSSTVYTAPPSSDACPVVFSADRLTTPGLSQAQTDSPLQQAHAHQQQSRIDALQQQITELETKRSEAAANLAQVPSGSDPSTTQQIAKQVADLDLELGLKRAELQLLNKDLASGLIHPASPSTGQGVQIKFKSSPSAIAAVDITVHGVSASPHLSPAVLSANRSDLSETFHLTGSTAAPLVESALNPRQPMIVSWVELTRIDYANGTVWQKSSTSRCAAAPSLFVLVDAGH